MTDRRSLPGSSFGGAETLLLKRIETAAAAGIDWIQLREKDLSDRQLIALARAALKRIRTRNSATRLFLNDRVDIALAAGAHGVHLSESGLPAADARQLRDDFLSRQSRPRDFLIGISCHSAEAVRGAASAGADYVYFGPVFETPSKAQYGAPQGPDRLAEACRAAQIPVIAIGGITLAKASEYLSAGAVGVAAIRLFQEANDVAAVVASLRGLLKS